MKIILCIDDTDDIEKGRGTGTLAEEILEIIKEKYLCKCEKVTRHQLLLHEDIPYTSHNSSMCFTADIKKEDLKSIIQDAIKYLECEHAKGSDPGLCVVILDELENKKKLINFGIRAKKEVLTKEQAYTLAKNLNIHLSEHGGTGQGVIGALAGAALRISGNDGEFKGCVELSKANEIYKVKEICQHKEVDMVMNLKGEILEDKDEVIFGSKAKTILLKDKACLLVSLYKKEGFNNSLWKTCNKQQIRKFGDERNVLQK